MHSYGMERSWWSWRIQRRCLCWLWWRLDDHRLSWRGKGASHALRDPLLTLYPASVDRWQHIPFCCLWHIRRILDRLRKHPYALLQRHWRFRNRSISNWRRES